MIQVFIAAFSGRRWFATQGLILLACLFLAGCGRRYASSLLSNQEEANQEEANQEDVSSASSAESGDVESARTIPASVVDSGDLSGVEPGTELAEADFRKTISETGANFIVLQVFAEACGPCMTEALHLTDKRKEWREAGIAILGMGMDETSEGPKAFFRHTGERIAFPLYTAPWFSVQQGVISTPTLFIYSAGGQQLYRVDAETAAEQGVMAALDMKLAELLP